MLSLGTDREILLYGWGSDHRCYPLSFELISALWEAWYKAENSKQREADLEHFYWAFFGGRVLSTFWSTVSQNRETQQLADIFLKKIALVKRDLQGTTPAWSQQIAFLLLTMARGDSFGLMTLSGKGLATRLLAYPPARIAKMAGEGSADTLFVAVKRLALKGLEITDLSTLLEKPSEEELSKLKKKELSALPGIDSPEKIFREVCRCKTSDIAHLKTCVGRDEVIEDLVRGLSKSEKKSVLLLGKPGSGKSNIVDGLASWIRADRNLQGRPPRAGPLQGCEIYQLEVGRLLGLASRQGEAPGLIQALIDFLGAHPNVILFIDEFHMLTGVGPKGVDAINLLKPAMADGHVRLIVATTFEEQKRYLDDDAVRRRVQEVIVPPTTEIQTRTILEALSAHHLLAHDLSKITPKAYETILHLAQEQFPNRTFPDIAIELQDEACAEAATAPEFLRTHASNLFVNMLILSGLQIKRAVGDDSGEVQEMWDRKMNTTLVRCNELLHFVLQYDYSPTHLKRLLRRLSTMWRVTVLELLNQRIVPVLRKELPALSEGTGEVLALYTQAQELLEGREGYWSYEDLPFPSMFNFPEPELFKSFTVKLPSEGVRAYIDSMEGALALSLHPLERSLKRQELEVANLLLSLEEGGGAVGLQFVRFRHLLRKGEAIREMVGLVSRIEAEEDRLESLEVIGEYFGLICEKVKETSNPAALSKRTEEIKAQLRKLEALPRRVEQGSPSEERQIAPLQASCNSLRTELAELSKTSGGAFPTLKLNLYLSVLQMQLQHYQRYHEPRKNSGILARLPAKFVDLNPFAEAPGTLFLAPWEHAMGTKILEALAEGGGFDRSLAEAWETLRTRTPDALCKQALTSVGMMADWLCTISGVELAPSQGPLSTGGEKFRSLAEKLERGGTPHFLVPRHHRAAQTLPIGSLELQLAQKVSDFLDQISKLPELKNKLIDSFRKHKAAKELTGIEGIEFCLAEFNEVHLRDPSTGDPFDETGLNRLYFFQLRQRISSGAESLKRTLQAGMEPDEQKRVEKYLGKFTSLLRAYETFDQELGKKYQELKAFFGTCAARKSKDGFVLDSLEKEIDTLYYLCFLKGGVSSGKTLAKKLGDQVENLSKKVVALEPTARQSLKVTIHSACSVATGVFRRLRDDESLREEAQREAENLGEFVQVSLGSLSIDFPRMIGGILAQFSRTLLDYQKICRFAKLGRYQWRLILMEVSDKIHSEELEKAAEEIKALLGEAVNEKLDLFELFFPESDKGRVDVYHIMKVVSKRTGMPHLALSSNLQDRVARSTEFLKEHFVGQPLALRAAIGAMRQRITRIPPPKKPQVFLELGPTGTGKSYLADLFAAQVAGSEGQRMTVDMNTYSQPHSVARIHGAPSGYIGHGQGKSLVDKWKTMPNGVVLLDEFGRADKSCVVPEFLGVFENGRLRDDKNEEVNLKGMTFFLTTNEAYQDTYKDEEDFLRFGTAPYPTAKLPEILQAIRTQLLQGKSFIDFLLEVLKSSEPLPEHRANGILAVAQELIPLCVNPFCNDLQENLTPENKPYLKTFFQQIPGSNPLKDLADGKIDGFGFNKALEHATKTCLGSNRLGSNLKDLRAGKAIREWFAYLLEWMIKHPENHDLLQQNQKLLLKEKQSLEDLESVIVDPLEWVKASPADFGLEEFLRTFEMLFSRLGAEKGAKYADHLPLIQTHLEKIRNAEIDTDDREEIRKRLEKRDGTGHAYPPEFLGRVEIIPFRSLSYKGLIDVAELELKKIQKTFLLEYNSQLTWSEELPSFLAYGSLSEKLIAGARSLNPLLKKHVHAVISDFLLANRGMIPPHLRLYLARGRGGVVRVMNASAGDCKAGYDPSAVAYCLARHRPLPLPSNGTYVHYEGELELTQVPSPYFERLSRAVATTAAKENGIRFLLSEGTKWEIYRMLREQLSKTPSYEFDLQDWGSPCKGKVPPELWVQIDGAGGVQFRENNRHRGLLPPFATSPSLKAIIVRK